MTIMDQQFLAGIGGICVDFSRLEMMLHFGVWALLGGTGIETQRTGQIVTAELSFQRSIQLFASLWRHRFEGRDDVRLRELCARLSELEQRRNRVVHSVWAAAEKPGAATRIKITARGVFKATTETVTSQELANLSIALTTAVSDILNFLFELNTTSADAGARVNEDCQEKGT
jgi:hypothetical protein